MIRARIKILLSSLAELKAMAKLLLGEKKVLEEMDMRYIADTAIEVSDKHIHNIASQMSIKVSLF